MPLAVTYAWPRANGGSGQSLRVALGSPPPPHEPALVWALPGLAWQVAAITEALVFLLCCS